MDSYLHQPRSLKQRRLVQEGTWLLIFFCGWRCISLGSGCISRQSLRQVAWTAKKEKTKPLGFALPLLTVICSYIASVICWLPEGKQDATASRMFEAG